MSEDTNRPASGSPPTRAKGWQPPSTEELQQLLPQYEITALLGRGGMGAVYKGTQKSLERAVAIKILPPGMDEDNDEAQFAERFKNEARAMARLSHPGIVAVYDSGETSDGLLYIVMEFIEGTDVQKMVSEQKRLHSEHAMAITAHVCDALQYAHDRNIIHRDIKPANIMVGYNGVVKVADFGLAKMSKADESGLTRSGMAMGTLHYMAPEALMLGSSVDHRADIYAVGVMLYFMLTGRLPQGMFELPSLQVPGLDPRYDSIIAKALRDDRELRYQTTAELRRDLDGILTQPVVKVEPGTREAQPALPTDVRPQQPEGGRRVMLRPQERVKVRVERRSSPLLWALVLVLSVFAIWTVLNRSQPESSKSEENATVAKTNPPASLPVAVTTPSQTTTPPPATSMPAPQALGVWQNLLVKDLRQTLDFQSGRYVDLVREPGGEANKPRYRSLANMMIFAKPPLKNGAIRARFGPGWQNNPPNLMVRYQGPGRFISNSIFNNSINLRRVFMTSAGQTSYTDFARKNLSSTVIPSDQSYEIELKAIDSKFTLLKDGEIVLEGTDSNYTDGRVGFFIEKGAVVESLEYMILPAPPQTAPYSPPTAASSPAVAGTVPATLPSSGWRPMIANMQDFLKQPGVTSMPNGWIRLEKTAIPLGESRNVLLRCKINQTNGFTAPFLPLRWSKMSNGDQSYLRCVIIRATSMSISRAWTDLKQLGWSNQSLIDKPLTTPLDAQEHELAFAAIGDSISAYLDGKLVATVNNVSCQGSLFGLHAIAPAVLKDPEWQPLDENGKQAIQSTPSSKTAASATTEVFRLDSSVITKDKPFVNSIGMTLVPVPGTKVLMCVHPTRKRDFAEFAATDASLNTFWQYRHPHTMPETEVNLCPVSNVNWLEAKAFCEWLGRKEGRAYRMPTDREWSLAVGIGHLESETATPLQLNEGVKGVFAWGTQWPPPANAGNLADTAATKSPNQQVIPGYTDGYSYLSPVMRFQPNELGLYDLAGNVFEWCEDWSDNQRQMRTMRGGAFNLFLPNILLASHRNHNLPERRSPNYGFRCVLDLSQASSNGTSNTSPDTPATPASAQKWIDNQGRSIIATFVRSDSVNVTLRMADGKEIPIALNRLSEESRRIASHLASITNPTTSVVSKGPFTNTLGMQLVPVPDTKVLFCIHETRRQDYAKFAAEFPGMDDNWARQSRDGIPVGDKDDHPVVGVNWESAKAFCEWLSSKEKRTYRLPTDREWSCAVGIGRDEASMAHLTPEKLSQQVKNEYPWGKSFPPPDRLGNLADRECGKAFRNQTVIGNYNDGYATTAPVMSFKPNKIGIYDLEGNVSEWCSDWYNEKMLNHVLRGGQWASFIPGYLLSSYRNQNPPNVYGAVFGFRIVLEIAP